MNIAIPQDPAPSLADVWRLFRESDRKFQETERLLKEHSLETERKFQETDRKFQETERFLKEHSLETERLLKEQRQETERQFQETSRELKEYARAAERRSKELDKRLGALGNRLGEFVEDMVAPGIKRLFHACGIVLRTVSRDVSTSNPALNLATQIDLFAIDGDCCVLIEVKSKFSIDDVNEHIERMEKFKPLFPEYADKKAFGAVAAMVMPEDVARYAYRQGFFVLAQQGESVVILNDDKFTPTAW